MILTLSFQHMKAWIERVILYKNRTIKKLLEELEAAEEQYSYNFQTHSMHIDQIIGEIFYISLRKWILLFNLSISLKLYFQVY